MRIFPLFTFTMIKQSRARTAYYLYSACPKMQVNKMVKMSLFFVLRPICLCLTVANPTYNQCYQNDQSPATILSIQLFIKVITVRSYPDINFHPDPCLIRNRIHNLFSGKPYADAISPR